MSRARIDAALVGDLRHFMADELTLAKIAVTRGVHSQATAIKYALRADVIAGGLGRRLSKSWQQENYPKGDTSLNAASYVFTKAEKLVAAFDEGVTIRSGNSKYLAIPTPSAPKKGLKGDRLSPANFPEHRYGPLRFVYVRGGTSLLVVDNQRAAKKGGYALSRNKKSLRTGNGLHTVPMFWLVPQVRLRRRLNSAKIEAAALSGLASEIDAAFNALSRRRLR
ncbi:hypothetical protein KO516_21410 [Citreicella sp. C3M06]|uniref:DUF6441 family protein n=1 Tax=Citreicella sp. C3M06 TaxID=2841564 RepID=UPI001C0A630E|nr:DUF6441 family protein [Citreicella sp. C3M06]MBU2963334.1 hypothetical protein [Citreicella sp. C3M06]